MHTNSWLYFHNYIQLECKFSEEETSVFLIAAL